MKTVNRGKGLSGVDIVKKITEVGMKNGMDISRAFSDMLDTFISFLSIERLLENNFDFNRIISSIKDDKWYNTFIVWLEWVNNRQKQSGVIDAFDFYEDAIKSKGKADVLGQFYTPMSLCQFMGEALYQGDRDVSVVNDSAVGSGRTLLGYANTLLKKKSKEVTYYIANDIDEQSVKMCTLNLCVNGLFGRVLCADGLTLHYNWGYEINESKYPMHTNVMSIRRLPNTNNSTDHQERQKECNFYMSLEKGRKEKLKALYELRNGNITPCVDMLSADNPKETIEITEELTVMAREMLAYYSR